MIKINLLGDNTAVDYSGHVFLGAYLSSVVLALGVCFFVSTWVGGEIEDLARQKESKEKDLARIKKVTQEVKEIEAKQKDLEDRLVRIATLKRNKQGPVRVLDALNSAIPERAWLMDARERENVMKLDGLALDGETISTFMRELEKSDYFPKVELDVARQTTRQGVKIQEFSIKASVSYAGKVGLTDSKDAADKPGDKPSGDKPSEKRGEKPASSSAPVAN